MSRSRDICRASFSKRTKRFVFLNGVRGRVGGNRGWTRFDRAGVLRRNGRNEEEESEIVYVYVVVTLEVRGGKVTRWRSKEEGGIYVGGEKKEEKRNTRMICVTWWRRRKKKDGQRAVYVRRWRREIRGGLRKSRVFFASAILSLNVKRCRCTRRSILQSAIARNSFA